MINTQNVSQSTGTAAGNPNPSFARSKDHDIPVKQLNLKEAGIVMAAVLLVGGLIAAYWFYSQQSESQAGGTVATASPQVNTTPRPTLPTPSGGVTARPASIAPVAPSIETMHADVYFDFDRSRLRADAVGILQQKAEFLKQDSHWTVLIQGHADQFGSIGYNKILASRRVDAVKQFLVELGVPGNNIKIVILGKEGSICDDQSAECQRLNRRVHLEMVKRSGDSVAVKDLHPVVDRQKGELSAVEGPESSVTIGQ